MTPKPICIMVCCNDDRGNFQGWADFIEVGDEDGLRLQGGRITFNYYPATKKARFGRLLLNALGHRTWCGNWCWDAVSLSPEDAAKLLNYLVTKADWHCEEGLAEVYDKFNTKGLFDALYVQEKLA